jgi:hypothetical protein
MTQTRERRYKDLNLRHDAGLRSSSPPFLIVFLAMLLSTSQVTVLASSQKNAVADNRWNWTQGWHGIVPGRATLSDAEKRLGPGKFIKFINAHKIYKFPKDVTMKINPATHKVETITVTNAVCPDRQFPFEKKEAVAKYRDGRRDTTGVTTTFSDEPEPHLVKLEFGAVQIVNDTPFIRCGLHH